MDIEDIVYRRLSRIEFIENYLGYYRDLDRFDLNLLKLDRKYKNLKRIQNLTGIPIEIISKQLFLISLKLEYLELKDCLSEVLP